jgi:integrase
MKLDGVNPIEARRTKRSSAKAEAAKAAATGKTLKECAEEYIADNEPGWRDPRAVSNWRASLRDHVYPAIGELPVRDIDLPLVLAVLSPMWKTKAPTAKRVRARIENVLDYATTRGYRSGDNPARWKGHLAKILPKPSRVTRVEHHAALPYLEIGAFMATLQQRSTVAAAALEFAILAASRTGEIRGARWDEIDLKSRIWTIPAERMKGDREHRVPLSDRAVEIIAQMEEIRTNEFVFPGRYGDRPLGHGALRDELESVGRTDLTAHGFRSTFASWAADRTNYPHEVRELALAHTVGSAVERAYQRSDLFDRRARLMQDWATFCESPPNRG